jgi:hypothetical protein
VNCKLAAASAKKDGSVVSIGAAVCEGRS